jgi:hypothetical protein
VGVRAAGTAPAGGEAGGERVSAREATADRKEVSLRSKGQQRSSEGRKGIGGGDGGRRREGLASAEARRRRRRLACASHECAWEAARVRNGRGAARGQPVRSRWAGGRRLHLVGLAGPYPASNTYRPTYL